ncbi:hypothetical protein [Acinetobacter guillouiae]|uniref:hypothetical protein n=1 Tax=Acinetobacter guillouiae TaxID=106649 RepID=UPI000BBC7AD1|nr:hypothetical protein [Acinetobacter guillouiae]
MKKILLLISCLFSTELLLAAPMGKLPIMVSRANCWAVTPVGIGYHNESLSYYVGDSADMWVRTTQVPKNKNIQTRQLQSGLGYLWDWRVYVSFVDKSGTTAAEHFWSVTGNHSTRFSLTNINSSNTSATNCNKLQGWPWNYANT